MKLFIHTRAIAAIGLLVATTCSPLHAAFIDPDGSTSPFEDWSRSDPNSMYAEWDAFTVANGSPGNAPDVGSFGPATANLEQNGASAIITGGGNIYSFAGVTDFDVYIPNYGYGDGHDTRVAVQLSTLGNPLDASSMRLSFDDGSINQTILPTETVGPTAVGDSQEWLFVWDLPSFNPPSMLVEFNSSASSMSLEAIVVDTYTQAIPEPSSLLLAVVGLAGTAAWRRKRLAARVQATPAR